MGQLPPDAGFDASLDAGADAGADAGPATGPSAGADEDPGHAGVRPFDFACHRCGHCCTHGNGHVWLSEGELEPMARRLGMTEEAFVQQHVRRVRDPRTGQERLSLREDERGRCTLLEGRNHCTVYLDRPEHCRTFPYWPSVLESEEGFEAAREVCPGIRPEVPVDVRERAFARLERLYAEFEQYLALVQPVCIGRGVCCRFEEAGHELFATPLEADYAAHRHPDAPEPEAAGRCPYHVGGRCTAREGRPLGCRTYFCDQRTTEVLERAHEDFLGRLRTIEREEGYPAGYARFPALMAARGIGQTKATPGSTANFTEKDEEPAT